MKLKLTFVILLQFVTIAVAEDPSAVERAVVESKQPITPSFYNGVIHLSDLSTSATAGGAMYTINAPGRYYVANDLGIAPSNSRVAAIKITVSNVFLDMNEATIYQRTGNSQTGLMGIEITNYASNVTIVNGKINGLNVSDTTEQNAGVVVGSGTYNITIEDVMVFGCESDADEVAGFLLSSCENVKLVNCQANNNTNTKSGASGSNGTVNGFKLSSCSCCVLQGCYANRNHSTDQNSYGIRLVSSTYNKILNCMALNQISNSNTSGINVVGFYSTGGRGNLFDGCESIGNQYNGVSATSTGAGFVLAGSEAGSTIRKNLAQANIGGSGLGYGISIGASVGNCCVQDNLAFYNTGTTGVGIIDAGATNVMYISNFAHSNTTGVTVDNYSGAIGEISTATHTVYTNLDAARTGYNNLEIAG